MESAQYDKIRMADHISSTFLSIYTQNAKNMHLRFGVDAVPVQEFFRLLLPCISNIAWPLDPDEIGRVWQELFIMTDNLTGMKLEIAMPMTNSLGPAEEVSFNPQGIHKAVFNDPKRAAQVRCKLPVDQATGFLRAPISEVRLTTFKRAWFLRDTVYLKRFRVTEDAIATTLFITTTPRSFGGARYSLTWIPHVHLKAQVIEPRIDVNWHSIAVPATNIWKGRKNNDPSCGELKALVWNVMGTVNERFGKAFTHVVRHERPQVVIIMGGESFGVTARNVTAELGFVALVRHQGDNGIGNGFWVLWNPKSVEGQALPFYSNGKHIRFKVINSVA